MISKGSPSPHILWDRQEIYHPRHQFEGLSV